MIDIILGVVDAMPAWIHALTALLTAATLVTALTPTRHDDAAVDLILRVLNLLAGNVVKNRNADDA